MSLSSHNDDFLRIRGARVHNLKNISVDLPRDKLVVITGPSGSGKSSLAFDTIYAEGQRRYVESLSVFARQFIDQLEKPQVESIGGLSPTISIEQKTTSFNPRSTVGTTTEVYDYLRVLYARISIAICYSCGKPIQSQTPDQMVDQIIARPVDTKLAILAPIVAGRKGEHVKELISLRQKGFTRVRINGEVFDLADDIRLEKTKKHDLDVFVDRLQLKDPKESLVQRIREAVDTALALGENTLKVIEYSKSNAETETFYSKKFACLTCGISYPEPEPRIFSFNSPYGACESCEGLGYESFALEEPALKGEIEETSILETHTPCEDCHGTRLKITSRGFKVGGKSITDCCALSISEARDFLTHLELSPREKVIASRLLKEVTERLEFLERVGVHYLSIDRRASTLSGGENQRIRLASQIGSSLVGVIYVLDEPSIGLHPRDHARLLDILHKIRDQGNTVLVVEHDRETIEQADWVVDMGPGAGNRGGEIIAEGTLQTLLNDSRSLTGQYLAGKKSIAVPETRRVPDPKRVIRIEGAKSNNLKNVSVTFPLGLFLGVTGVSGSGKSSLVIETLYRAMMKHLYRSEVGDLKVDKIEGLNLIDKVIDIDQSPIGRTPRSNPATYTGLFSLIRTLYSRLPDAQVRGYGPGRFSFNVKGGRCEVCEGDGVKKIEMHFLPNVRVLCTGCKGLRYNRETLSVRYKGKSIADVLEMTAEEALGFFEAIPAIRDKIRILNEVGLGYIHLGQSATTLSGGEAQRIKLAKELARRDTGKTFYILDEPTTGLHFDDIAKLLAILQRLVDHGNTVLVIEHNLDVIKAADYLIDMGPEGGKSGGSVLAVGTPEAVSKTPASSTGKFLSSYLNL